MAFTLSNGVLSDFKTTTQTTNLQFSDFVGEINLTTSGGGGGGGGVGEWFFYSDEGNINAGPPQTNGNIIFTIQGFPVVETFNPNGTSGTTYINICAVDSNGTSYLTQFNTLAASGGTLSITQNGDTATYSTNVPGGFFVETTGNPFLVISTTIQTVTSSAPFVYADPISITIS